MTTIPTNGKSRPSSTFWSQRKLWTETTPTILLRQSHKLRSPIIAMSSPCDVVFAEPVEAPLENNQRNDEEDIYAEYRGQHADLFEWLDSDDPESIRQHTERAPQGEPKDGVGCWEGFRRDGHVKHTILYLAMVAYGLALIILRQQCINGKVYYYGGCHFFSRSLALIPLAVLYILFMVEFTFSSTNRYLRHTESMQDALAFLDKMSNTKPDLSLSMECYHYETHTVTDSDGKKKKERTKVTTWRGTHRINIVHCTDVTTNRLNERRLREFQLTKVKLDKTFTADANYETQKANFVQRNRHRDRHYNLYVNFDIPGFRSRLMSYVQFDKIPWLFGWDVMVLCHVLVLPALPYRIWLSSICGKLETIIHKKLETR